MWLGHKEAEYCVRWLFLYGQIARQDKVELAKDQIEKECEIIILEDTTWDAHPFWSRVRTMVTFHGWRRHVSTYANYRRYYRQ